jgi:tetratricopeptide (TPR) repeat protein
MELKLKLHSKNSFPKEGIFIKSKSIGFWLDEIQNLGLTLENCRVFPVPGTTANELYGCMVLVDFRTAKIKDLGKNNFYQLIENKLFIPENTTVVPKLAKEEWSKLFSDHFHLLHPDIGLVELEQEIVWADYIQKPNLLDIEVIEPRKSVAIPSFISSLRIEVDQEELLKQIEDPYSEEEKDENLPFNLKKLMMGNNKEMDKFLAYLEKNPEKAMKLAIPLDTIGSGRGGHEGQFTFNSGLVNDFNLEGLGQFLNKLFSGNGFTINMIRWGILVLFVVLVKSCDGPSSTIDFGSIMKFMFLCLIIFFFIRAAIGDKASDRNRTKSSGGAALVDSDRFNTLQSRYEKMAEEYVSRKEYEKAAHIYLKLLKNNHKAAMVLEQGQLYREAAGVYLKYLKNRAKAAECYEKGHVYSEAIVLYKELNDFEKVGDLYLSLKNKKEADKHFRIVTDNYEKNSQYVKASLIYRNKIGEVKKAQELLLEGWRTNKDPSKCLNNYFANILSVDVLSTEISTIYEKEVDETSNIRFLNILKHEFSKDQKLEEVTRNIAYQIVADKIEERPELASELLHFNKNNTSMTKDVMKYKLKVKRTY